MTEHDEEQHAPVAELTEDDLVRALHRLGWRTGDQGWSPAGVHITFRRFPDPRSDDGPSARTVAGTDPADAIRTFLTQLQAESDGEPDRSATVPPTK
jgi:hypothetical protein